MYISIINIILACGIMKNNEEINPICDARVSSTQLYAARHGIQLYRTKPGL